VVIDNKVEGWNREKLEREFKSLFFKCREIKSLMEGYRASGENLKQEL
jgi:hypothetical protein